MATLKDIDPEYSPQEASPPKKLLTLSEIDADQPEQPQAMPEDVPGVGETILTKFAHGAAGEFPAKAGAAISAAMGMGPEETFGERYRAALAATKRREEAAAREHPVVSGLSEAAGSVAPYVAGGSFLKGAGSLADMAGRGALLSGTQSFLKEGVEGVPMGAAMGAAGPVFGAASQLIGKTAPTLGKAVSAAPALYGYQQGARTILDPEATAAEKAEAFGGFLFDVGARGFESLEKKAGQHDANRRAAVEQLEHISREELQRQADRRNLETWKEDNRVRQEKLERAKAEQESNEINRKHEQEQRDLEDKERKIVEHDLPRAVAEHNLAVDDHNRKGEKLSAERKRLESVNDESALEAHRKLEDEWLADHQQLQDEEARIRAEHEQKQKFEAFTSKESEFREVAKKKQKEIARLHAERASVEKEQQKAISNAEKALAEAEELKKSVDSRAHMRWVEQHRASLTDIANILRAEKEFGVPVDPKIRPLMERLAQSLVENSKKGIALGEHVLTPEEGRKEFKKKHMPAAREAVKQAKAALQKAQEPISAEEIARRRIEAEDLAKQQFEKSVISSPEMQEFLKQHGGEYSGGEFRLSGDRPAAPVPRSADLESKIQKIRAKGYEPPEYKPTDVTEELKDLALKERRHELSAPEPPEALERRLAEIRELRKTAPERQKAALDLRRQQLLAALARIRPRGPEKGVVTAPEVETDVKRRLSEARAGIKAGFERAMVPGRTIPGQIARDVASGPLKKIPLLGPVVAGESSIVPRPETVQSMLVSEAGKYKSPARAAVALEDIAGFYRKPQTTITKGIEKVGRPVEKVIGKAADLIGKKYQPAGKIIDFPTTTASARTAAILANIKKRREIEERKKKGGK